MTRAAQVILGRSRRDLPFDRDLLMGLIRAEVSTYALGGKARSEVVRQAGHALESAGGGWQGQPLSAWWPTFEATTVSAAGRGLGGRITSAAVRALVTSRLVRPSWELLTSVPLDPWVSPLPVGDPLQVAAVELRAALAQVTWASPKGRKRGVCCGTRVLLLRDYDRLEQITDDDVNALPISTPGIDLLDAALCQAGVFPRSARRGTARRFTAPPHTIEALAVTTPESFRPAVVAYLHAYQDRVSDKYLTARGKARSLAHFFDYLTETHPKVISTADVLPHHARGFIEWALPKARSVQRDVARKGDQDRTTSYDWFVEVRSFFADLCHWGTEPGSPLAQYAPPAIPLTRHDLQRGGFGAARARTQARMTATVMDLTREIPNIRAHALQDWTEATNQLEARSGDRHLIAAERRTFWDWAFLELLLTSGLRVEEACQLTTLDVLKRQLPNGEVYYLLHVKPSKFDRARVIPIGDGLGNVIAEIITHIKDLYGTDTVPFCDRRDMANKKALPRAPYLIQGRSHPSAVTAQTIRGRLRHLSLTAGATHADGTPLHLTPHDCRRVFATNHLNSNTPVHVIAALLGHAGLDTVMIYAKLYPDTLVEGYRTAMRGLHGAIYNPDQLTDPSSDDWAAFTAASNLRDMGTHICALPTGEHCSRGLVCLGCVHAQPKKSAAPTFRRMIASHTRALTKAHEVSEPAGQLAARELEIDRLQTALQRTEELSHAAADALEAAAT